VSLPDPEPNHGVLAPREARNLGSGCKSMQLVVVPQEVSTSGCKSSLMKVQPTGQERTRVPPRQGPYGAGGSEEIGRVIEPRNGESRGEKADGVHALAGRSPGCVLARIEDTPGV